MSREELSSQWEELKAHFASLDLDVHKALFSENVSASSRARVGMRDASKKLKSLVKGLLVFSKEVAAKKKEEKSKEA